jgi:hypothetical protein
VARTTRSLAGACSCGTALCTPTRPRLGQEPKECGEPDEHPASEQAVANSATGGFDSAAVRKALLKLGENFTL